MNKPQAHTIEQLRILCIDLSSKQWTAYIFNDWIKHEEGKWHNGTDQQNYQRIKQLIERLQVNYVVYERYEIDKIPERPEGQDGFLRYIRLTHFLVNYAHRHKIAGAVIFPGEVNKYIKGTAYCWRDPYLKTPNYCDRHKQEAPCNWYQGQPIPIKDEVDARALWEIWQYKDFINDYEWLKERERIHQAPPRLEKRNNSQQEADKWTRLGTQRNYYRSNELEKQDTNNQRIEAKKDMER